MGDEIYCRLRRAEERLSPVKLPPFINTRDYEYSANVDPSGRRLFLTRNGKWMDGPPADILSVPLCAIPALRQLARP